MILAVLAMATCFFRMPALGAGGRFCGSKSSGVICYSHKKNSGKEILTKKHTQPCPHCGQAISIYQNPVPTVDIIIELDHQIVLIERKNPPYGWAIPGGFVDYGETVETAAVREAKEETSLDVELVSLLGVYSDPTRDARMHTISTVYVAQGNGTPRAADDAKSLQLFKIDNLPPELAFDHRHILDDYLAWKKSH